MPDTFAREGRERRQRLPFVPIIDLILIVLVLGSAKATAQVWHRSELERAIDLELESQTVFWSERACELCVPRDEIPALPRTDSGLDAISRLSHAREFRDSVWASYRECVDERVEVIPEELLRFAFDRSDAFDMTPADVEVAKDRIRSLVDGNRSRRRIYVRGHTDRKGTDEYNFVLSARRAWYVGQVVLEHLVAQGLVAGRDFELIPEGLGKTRQVERRDGETDEQFDSRCRRIELAFQIVRPGSGR